MNSETENYAQHFTDVQADLGLRPVPALVAFITDGEYPLDKIEQFYHWPELLEECMGVITDMAAQEFKGRWSLHFIMQAGMKRFTRKYGYKVPGPWLPILKVLKEGGPCQYNPREEEAERKQREEDRTERWNKYMPPEFQK